MVGLELIEFLTTQQQAKEASHEYQARRAKYLQARKAELDTICALYADYLSQLRSQPRAPWDRYVPAHEDEGWSLLQADADFELGISYRILVHAVEGFLLTCMEISCVAGESVLAQVSSADELIAMLQAEEDSMIATFGPPWDL